jgi:hypothetical protein
MNIEKALTRLAIIAALLLTALVVARLLPSDTRYNIVFSTLLLACAGAIRPLAFLFTGGGKRHSILTGEKSRRSS